MSVCAYLQVDDLWHVDQKVLELHRHTHNHMTTASELRPTFRPSASSLLPFSVPPLSSLLCLSHLWLGAHLDLSRAQDFGDGVGQGPQGGQALVRCDQVRLGERTPTPGESRDAHEGSEKKACGVGNGRDRSRSMHMIDGMCLVPDECVQDGD